MKNYLLVISSIISFSFSFNKGHAQDIVVSGEKTKPINFPAGSCVYNWTNNKTSIGLPAKGTGNIPSFTAKNTGSSPVTATIIGTPVVSGFAYIVNAGSNNVSVIDLSTHNVVATIPVGSNPNSVCVDPNYNEVYIVNNGSSTVSVINTLTNKVKATIAVGPTPWSVTVSPDGSLAYVADGGGNDVEVIDATTNTIVAKIPAGTNPNALAVSPDGSLLYVNNSNSVTVINASTHAVVATIPVGSLPQAILITPDGSKVYEANYLSNDVYVINTATNKVIAKIAIGANPGGGSMSPDGSVVYIANEGSNSVSVISTATNSVIKTIAVGASPWGVSVRPDGSQIYVGNSGSNTVSVIDAATGALIANIPVGSEPYSFGNFFSGGMNCTALVKYTITVKPLSVAVPTIVAGAAAGTISACLGTASASPNLQQFTVSGGDLTGSIKATAPAGFELSLAKGSGYGSSVTIAQTSGTVGNTVVYVRLAATALAGSISGNITLTSAGASNQTVAVTGTVNALPTVNVVANQTVSNGEATSAISFTGTGNTFTWVNDTPGIGLAASGSGDIAPFTAINTGYNPVTATIKATPIKSGIAYIANSGSNTVTVINTGTNAVITNIPVGSAPIGVASSPDGSRVYVSCYGTIAVINTATNTVVSTISIGTYAWTILVSPDGSKLYVAYPQLYSVDVIDAATGSVISTIVFSDAMAVLAISPDGSTLYVGNSATNTVLVVSTANNAIIATIPVGLTPNCAAISPDSSRLYVTNADSGNLSVINTATNTVTATVAVGSYPYGVVVSPDGSRVYVANNTAASVSVIDAATNAVISTVPAGSEPTGISITSDGSLVYVVDGGGNGVSVINTATNTVTATMSTGQAPYSIGNFITPAACSGLPTTFTVTVNPSPPTITASPATGTISACVGTASASPQIQQFIVSGGGLTADIRATAPASFEVSLTEGSGYANSVTIPQTSGALSSTVVYVRSEASAPTGNISGDVTLTSTGGSDQTVAVKGTVNALPTVNAVANQTKTNGDATDAISFTGTGNTFTWVNDTPGIGLAASGSGDIASFTAVNTGTSPVTATITVVPQLTSYAYITTYGANKLTVINTNTRQFVGSVTLGQEPGGVAVSPDGTRVFVTVGSSGGEVINIANNKLIGSFSTGFDPLGIAISPDGKYAYTANQGDNNVTVIDATTYATVATIPVGVGAYEITVSPDGKMVAVSSLGGSTVTIIDALTNKVIASPASGSAPAGLIFTPDGKRLYVANTVSNTVAVFNTSDYSLLTTITVGTNPESVAVNPDGKTVYVTNSADNTVSFISTATNTITDTLPVGSNPQGISVTPDGKYVYETNLADNDVWVIDTSTRLVIAKLNAGQNPWGYGNFISPGTGCTGTPITFTIKVNPTSPTITVGTATGTISACAGAPSADPDIQRFTVSGSGLTGSITATAPTGFELSLTAGSGYGNSVTLPQTSGAVVSTVVYVRSAATAASGSISGNVTLTSPGAPDQTISVTATVNPVVNASVTISASGNNICAGTPVTFTAIPVNGGSSPVYQWSVNGNVAEINIGPFSSSTLANGDLVSCVMTSNAACATPAAAISNSITMNVTANAIPSVSIIALQNSICAGTPVTFTAAPVNGGGTQVYQWLVNGNNAGTNSNVFSGSNFADGDVVTCVMTSNAVCAAPANVTSNSITMSVGAVVSPAVSIAASQNNICPGTNITFTATPTNGGNTPVYQWLLNGNSVGTNSATFASSTLLNGDIISCRLTSNANCLTLPDAASNNITITVDAQAAPAVSISISANNVCAGTPVTFTATPTNGGSSPVYQWLLNGNNTGTNSPTFSSTLANDDVVRCVMTSSLGCATPTTITSNNIVANILPVPVVNAGENKTIEKGNSVALAATAQGNITDITWSPVTGLDNYKILNPKASPASTTLYTITVQTAGGCTDTGSVTVTVLDGIIIPNTFTPNGDGVNDKWNIRNLKDYLTCVVRIYDRWGTEVYSSIGYYNAWDGTYKGRPLSFGTYYYVINLNDGTAPLSGFVALIR